MLIYVSGPYTNDDRAKVDANIQQARQVAIELWELGHAVICPHLNTSHFEDDCKATYEQYIAGDLDMISRCDAMVLTPNWKESNGAKIEYEYAKSLGVLLYVYPDLPTLHPTETRCPQQSQAFREVLGRMYRTHLKKNADYSPANILGPGEVGLVTRLWDKVARLMNLVGFRFKIVEPGRFEQPMAPECEAIEDTYIDLAVYGVIGLLVRQGKWGR